MDKHDCTSVLSKVVLALDGELTTLEEKDFLEELQKCSWCLEHYEIEHAFKKFLCQKIQRKEVTGDLVANIKLRIKEISPE